MRTPFQIEKVCQDTGQLMGYVHGYFEEADEAVETPASIRVTQLRVGDEFRMQGVGRQLVTDLETYGQERGASEVYATVASDKPESAEQFWLAMGYTIEDVFSNSELFKEI